MISKKTFTKRFRKRQDVLSFWHDPEDLLYVIFKNLVNGEITKEKDIFEAVVAIWNLCKHEYGD